LEVRLALSGTCTMLVFSLNTRACSVVKATLQQSPGKQREKTLMSWPDLWDYSCPGECPFWGHVCWGGKLSASS
uniref:Uncharacterized protein n=1 Tax=Calidris pygmaea TaxID=425635 RepID=A0A8C3KAN5_9CHAR